MDRYIVATILKTTSENMTDKALFLKPLKLANYLFLYHNSNSREQVEKTVKKFRKIWGGHQAAKYLMRYHDAAEMIYYMEEEDLKKFKKSF